MDRLLVAVDVDGTLVDAEFDDRLRAPEIAAIRRVREAGHVLALCTGRNRRSCAWVVESTEGALDGAPRILLNGAVVLAGDPPETLREAGLDRPILRRLVELFRSHDVLPMVFETEDDGGRLIHEPLDPNPVLAEYLRRRRDSVGAVDVVEDLLAALPERALEVGSIDEAGKVRALTDRLRGDLGDAVRVINTESLLQGGRFHWVEAFQAESDKGSAVGLLAGELGIPMERVVAVGDNYNDLDMFARAGHSAAMGNAPDEVRRSADRVVGHVRENGAARLLDEIADGLWPIRGET